MMDWIHTPWFVALFIAVFGTLFVWLGSAGVHRRFTKSGHAHWALVARTALRYLGMTSVGLAVARTAGVDLTALIATAGVATIAIGFAAQTSLGNLIAGIFLLVDRPFEVDDAIEIEGREGIVREITLLSVRLRTFDNLLVRVPNETALKATVVNLTRMATRRVDVPILLPYGSDIEQVRKTLVLALKGCPEVLLDPESAVVTLALTENAVRIQVRAWVSRPGFIEGRTAVVETIHRTLRDAKIRVAFPQITFWPGSSGD
ncbi:MAG: small conductance mechanosensitive channel [Myxococcota bacterium]|jgi:small conductance mechanosensitive channel